MKIEDMEKVAFTNQRVLTTKQLAELYNCPVSRIKDNFSRARHYFKEGVHYFKLTGAALREFKNQRDIVPSVVTPGTSVVYLWTEAGCLYHCKIINTQEAWRVFGDLVRLYFAVKEGLLAEATGKNRIAPARKPPADLACVYAFDMSNNLTKIGHTADIADRMTRIKRINKLEIRREHHSPFMPRSDARRIERALHRRFAQVRVQGEFFQADFEEVVDEMQKNIPVEINLFEEQITESAPDHRRTELLIELLKVPLDNPALKEKLFKETANLLLGKNIF